MAPGALIDHAQTFLPTQGDQPVKLQGMFRDMNTLELHSSGGPIDSDSIGCLKPTSKDTPLEQMREQYARDGYLWVKDVLPKEDVWKMRETYFDYLPGLTKEGTAPRDGIYNGSDWRLVRLSHSQVRSLIILVDATWQTSS